MVYDCFSHINRVRHGTLFFLLIERGVDFMLQFLVSVIFDVRYSRRAEESVCIAQHQPANLPESHHPRGYAQLWTNGMEHVLNSYRNP